MENCNVGAADWLELPCLTKVSKGYRYCWVMCRFILELSAANGSVPVLSFAGAGLQNWTRAGLCLLPISHKSISEVGHTCCVIRLSSQSVSLFIPELFGGGEVMTLCRPVRLLHTKFRKPLTWLCVETVDARRQTVDTCYYP